MVFRHARAIVCTNRGKIWRGRVDDCLLHATLYLDQCKGEGVMPPEN